MAHANLYRPPVRNHNQIVEQRLPAGSALFQRLGMLPRDTRLIEAIHSGFPVSVVERLAEELGTAQKTLLQIAHITPATLTRRRRATPARLSVEESDRIYRIAAAYRSALQLFEGDGSAARAWLTEPARALGGASPLQHLDTEAGADEVQDLIGRLEQGVYT